MLMNCVGVNYAKIAREFRQTVKPAIEFRRGSFLIMANHGVEEKCFGTSGRMKIFHVG